MTSSNLKLEITTTAKKAPAKPVQEAKEEEEKISGHDSSDSEEEYEFTFHGK